MMNTKTLVPDRPGWRALAFLILFTITAASQAGVRAMLDRSTVYEGDTVTLTIEADGGKQDAEPDLSVLEKDFDILGTGTSRQIRIINGRRSDKLQWRVELDPKRSGKIDIPPIVVGKDSTRALTLDVTRAPAPEAGSPGQGVFLQLETGDSAEKPFVQQQVPLTMRLFYRIPLVEGSFEDPKPDNTVVERLGDDRQYQTSIDGQPYQVIERRYALFPEKSGTLTIPPVRFTGRVVSSSTQRRPSTHMDSMLERFFGGRNPFDDPFFSRDPFGDPGKRIRVRSQPLTLEVQPRPSAWQGRYWLPSTKVVLEDSWAEGPPEFRVGEPVTRTITLRARGLESSQLPDIEMPTVDGMRIYPEQAVVENHTDGEWVFGTRKQVFAYVPARAGEFTLPEIRLDWWDTESGKPRTAVLPPWKIRVEPGAGGATASVGPAQAAPDTGEPEATPDTPAPAIATARSLTGRLQTWWPWAAGVVVLAGLLLFGLRHRPVPTADRPPVKPSATERPVSTSGREARHALENACVRNDPRAAARALLEWAAVEWPDDPPRNLGRLATCIDSGVDEVHELERVLYAPGQTAWNGSALKEAFRKGLVQRKNDQGKHDRDQLAPLYPHPL